MPVKEHLEVRGEKWDSSDVEVGILDTLKNGESSLTSKIQ